MIDSHPYPRFTKKDLLEALQDTPVVLIHGSRQCGKTTLAQTLSKVEPGSDHPEYAYITFDNETQLQAAKADPVGFVRDLPKYVILDEIQRIPELFSTIKDSVDQDRLPGRFVLTGSANVLLLPRLSDSLAGRMEIIRLRPLAQAELIGTEPNLLNRLFATDENFMGEHTYPRLGESLAEIICTGGYPAAIVRKTEKRRGIWYRDYIETIVQRDVRDIANIRNLDVLHRLLALAASQTAHLFISASLAAPFSLSHITIRDYLALLNQLFLIEQLQPWHSNRIRRLIKTPKMHLADTGLACALLGVNAKELWRDKSLLGQLLETFIYQELRKHGGWHEEALKFYHFRNKDQVEVDIVIEQGKQLVGIEVKAAATVRKSDFKGLQKLRDACGENFAKGIVFYDVEHRLAVGEKLCALPISEPTQS